MPRILILLAHPDGLSSKLHQTLLQGLEAEVTIRDLYQLYPDFLIDAREERELLLAADLVILQFPLYWYSFPALLKEWFDSVWRLGFAYERESFQLAGKDLLPVLTIREDLESYSPSGRNRFTLAELLRPLEASALLARMNYHPAFVVSGTRRIQEPAVMQYRSEYQTLIRQYLKSGSASLAMRGSH